MFGKNVKLDKVMLERSKRCARIAGYASVEEFIEHALEKELSKLEKGQTEDEVRQRLKGLGYIS